MNKIILATGGRYKLDTVFRDLQDYAYANLTNYTDLLFDSYGVNVATQNGVCDPTDDSLQVSIVNGNVHVQAGDALTASLSYINVSTAADLNTDSITASGIYSLYVKYVPVYDKLTEAVNGSASVPRRETGSYEFVWSNPLTSGVYLADITRSATAWDPNSVVDKRQTNVLKIAKATIPDTVARTDRTYTQVFSGPITVPQLSVKSGANEIVITPGTAGAQTLTGDNVQTLLANTHVQNTDTGTTSTSFRIGVGTIGINNAGLVAVTTDDASPKDPQNFKITDINSTINSVYTEPSLSSVLSISAVGSATTPLAKVNFSWGYDAIGSGTAQDTFVLTSGVWGNGTLAGYYLYAPASNLSLYINNNTGSTLDVRNVNLSHITTSGIVISAGNPGLIYTDADRYELTAIPYNSANALVDSARIVSYIQSPLNTSANITVNKGSLNLYVGQKYQISVRALKQYLYSESTVLLAGSYTKDPAVFSSATINYASPTIIQMPSLLSNQMSLSLTTTRFGFRAQINGSQWDAADAYEFAWSTVIGGANFNDGLSSRISSSTIIDVTTSEPHLYNVVARPIMSNQSVQDPNVSGLSGNIISGAGGLYSDTYTLSQFSVHHRTYSGVCWYTMGASSVTSYLATIALYSGIISPASGTPGVDQVWGDKLVGEVIRLANGREFLLQKYKGLAASSIYHYNYEAKALFQPTGIEYQANVPYMIGTTEFGREVHRLLAIPKDTTITGVFVDSDIASDGDTRVRWYQATNKAGADSVLVTGSNAGFFQDADTTVYLRDGARDLIVDLYDDTPNSTNNYSGFDGTITLYAR